MDTSQALNSFPVRAFLLVLAINAVWINASEVFRYFVFVMPMMRESLWAVDNVAPMSWGVFALWGLWDTLLLLCVSGFIWVLLDRFGDSLLRAIVTATYVWASIFGIFWIAMYNMNLATPAIVFTALSLSWIELVVAALIIRWGRKRYLPCSTSPT